jgi:hypothetical protein
MIEHLQLPGVQLGALECVWLRWLLESVQFKRKKAGGHVPVGQQSMEEKYQIGAAHVREWMQTNKGSQPTAIDTVIKAFPEGYFGDKTGDKLADFMKRGPKRTKRTKRPAAGPARSTPTS